MVTITTTLFTNDPVNTGDGNVVDFESGLSASSTEMSWLAGFGSANIVRIQGSGLTYSGSGDGRELSGGTISRIVLDVGNDNGSTTAGDLVITGTEGLNPAAIPKNDVQGFWGEILKGDDVLNIFGLGEDDVGFGPSLIFGDDLRLVSSAFSSASDAGGDDDMFGADNEVHMVGDVSSVRGNTGGDFILPATYTGGDDFISGATTDRRNNLIGDAGLVSNFGEVIGGNDQIDGSRNSNVSTSIVGDVDNVQDNGFVRGGNDTLSLGLAGVITGDVLFMLGANPFVIGGNDVIDGRQITGGGDVYEVVSTVSNGIIQCGADTMQGIGRNDRMSGDIYLRNSDKNTVTGGDDLLIGRDGNDRLFGEVFTGSLLAVTGGNDHLMGGANDDLLSGQTGDDLLEGGADSDRLLGGIGADRLDGGTGLDIMAGNGGPDRFLFGKLADSAVGALRDVISDFSLGQNDRIDVSDIDAKSGTRGNNAFGQFIGSSNFSAEGQIRAFQQGANTVVEFNTMGNSDAEMQIALQDFTANTLSLSDFVA